MLFITLQRLISIVWIYCCPTDSITQEQKIDQLRLKYFDHPSLITSA